MALACTERGCPTMPMGTRIQHCTICHETFNGNQPGDMHRVGSFSDGGRRCLTVPEMIEKGMELDQRGRWRTGKPYGGSVRDAESDRNDGGGVVA